MNNTHKVYSRVYTNERDKFVPKEVRDECYKISWNIETILRNDKHDVSILESHVDEYFITFLLHAFSIYNPEKILALKDMLKVHVNTPYMKIFYPSNHKLAIKIPNPMTTDPAFSFKYRTLTKKDFQFIDIFVHVVDNHTVDIESLEFFTDASEDEIRDILVDMINIGLITKERINAVSIYDCSKYWLKWKEMAFNEILDRSELSEDIQKYAKEKKKDLKRALIRRVQTGNTDPYIILCDQEQVLLDSYSGCISTLDSKIICCKDSYEVFDALGKYKCKLFITDLMLPSIDGLDTIKIIRNNYLLRFPIIVLTNMTSENIIKEVHKYDIQEYLVKTDLDFNGLEQIVKNYL